MNLLSPFVQSTIRFILIVCAALFWVAFFTVAGLMLTAVRQILVVP